MSISFVCPKCARPFRVKDEFAGKRSKCPTCGSVVTVPRQQLGGEVFPVATFRPQPIAEIKTPVHYLPEPARSADVKDCPFCGEEIKLVAAKCKHCGETVDPVLRKAEESSRERTQGRAPAPVQAMSAPVNVRQTVIVHGKKPASCAAGCLTLVILIAAIGFMAHSCGSPTSTRPTAVQPTKAKPPEKPKQDAVEIPNTDATIEVPEKR